MSDPPRQPDTGAAPRAKPAPGRRLFLKQPIMLRVIYALVPIALAATYFFGLRVLAVLAVCNAAGLAAEWLMARQRKAPVSQACLVTCWLYALSLPPTVPFWVAAVGAVVAIVFAKEVFGGFGRNFSNPAITGRAFVYICFPNDLTQQFVPAFNPGFLGMYTDEATLKQLAHEYKVVYQKTSVKGVDDYLVDHSAGTYISDPQGHLRLLMPYGSSPDAIAQDLKTLLAAS